VSFVDGARLWNINGLDGGQGCGRVLSELVLRKKNCSCIDACRWELDMIAVIEMGILKLKGCTMGVGGRRGE
jgi:hypothetical protein